MAADDKRPSRNFRYRSGQWYEFDPDRLALIVAFVAVSKHLSFVGAANELNVMSSTVSRQIQKLEDSLGVRLFARTTRRVSMTEAGELYFRECRTILQRMNEADAMISALNDDPRGQLRLSVPVALGRYFLNAAVVSFLNLYPNVQVEIDLSDRFVDMVGEGFDLVVRTGVLSDSGLISQRVGTNERIIVASPRYISVHGVPTVPQDLMHHNCLRYRHHAGGGGLWVLARGDEREHVEVSGNYSSSNSDAVFDAAVSGLGIAMVSRFLANDHVESGRLVPLLQDWHCDPEVGIYVLYPSSKYLSPKVKTFVSFLREHFRRFPAGERAPLAESHSILDDLV